MIRAADKFEGRSTGSVVRIDPVHWDGHGRVSVIGEIDLSNVRDAEAALSHMVCGGTPLTLDLIGLSYLDSQGVAMLFRLAARARGEGGSLTLANPQRIVRRVIEIVHLEDAITMVDDV
jgi:anti-anti-sigma factor